MLNVKISIDDGAGKKAEINLSESDNLSKLVIIQNVFQLFGISNDVLEMASTFSKTGEAYATFFKEVEPIEPTHNKIEDIQDKIDIKQKLIDGYTENELEHTYQEKSVPEWVTTGIKIDSDGTKRYRLHYHCIACFRKGTHYIYDNSKTTFCHICRHEMVVYPAHPEGFPNQDSFGNFFRSGDFRDRNLNWE